MGFEGEEWNDIVLRLLRGILSAIAKKFPRKVRAVHQVSSIVIFSTAGDWDILSAASAIRAVRETHCGRRITVVVHHRPREARANSRRIDALMPHRKAALGYFRTVRVVLQARSDPRRPPDEPSIYPAVSLSFGGAELSWPPGRHVVLLHDSSACTRAAVGPNTRGRTNPGHREGGRCRDDRPWPGAAGMCPDAPPDSGTVGGAELG